MSFFLASRNCCDSENDNPTARCDDSFTSYYENDRARFNPFKVFGPSALKKVEHPLLVMVSIFCSLFCVAFNCIQISKKYRLIPIVRNF